jgi:L-threonylcarbamoyladenylate synthase
MSGLSVRTRVLKVNSLNPEPDVIRAAAALLKRGGLVAFPTETVYGLGANLQDPQAVQELYQVKQRPFEKQATLHIADFSQVEAEQVEVTPLARELMRRFWPGPMTLVLPRLDGSTIGFRMPNHPVALALLKEAAVPVVAPSANLTGQPPAVTAEQVLKVFENQIDVVLDGGPAVSGISSTVVDLSSTPPRLLREGTLAGEIRQLLEQ